MEAAVVAERMLKALQVQCNTKWAASRPGTQREAPAHTPDPPHAPSVGWHGVSGAGAGEGEGGGATGHTACPCSSIE